MDHPASLYQTPATHYPAGPGGLRQTFGLAPKARFHILPSLRQTLLLLGVLMGLLGISGGTASAAQPSVRAWTAQGQVWVVWNWDTNNPPASFAIYARTNTTGSFTNVAQGTLVGRLLQPEWSGSEVLQQSFKAFGSPQVSGYVVPTNNAGGTYTLAPDEGLFVETIRPTTGPRVYAVVPFGQSNVTAQRRSAVVPVSYSPNEKPALHRQTSGNNTGPSNTPFPVAYYVLWADGDSNDAAGRPDFPIMGNAAKRGAPHLNLIVAPPGGLAGRTNVPAAMVFHGGDANASFWLPSGGASRTINILPTDGYVIAPDEKVWSVINGVPSGENSRWFGYVAGFDPFVGVSFSGVPTNMVPFNPPAKSVIIDYTHRQLEWALHWFQQALSLDAHRVALLGHSAGSVGANHLGRMHPELFSSVELFNCGQRYYESPLTAAMQGEQALNLPTNRTNRFGAMVHLLDLFPFTVPLSGTQRDYAFTRIYAGKCDQNPAMHWGPDMVSVLRQADTEGWGDAFFWDLRKHGLNEWQDYWVDATSVATLAQQTRRDDGPSLARYRSNQSFPAFFNFQKYPSHGDPGPGGLGGIGVNACINNPANGDDHGTWGGYYDWRPDDLVDSSTNWACTVFLEGAGANFAAVDACPFPSLRSDLAVRRPQKFLPVTGSQLNWVTRRVANNSIVQSGTIQVAADGLIVLTNITVPRWPEMLRIEVIPLAEEEPKSPLPGTYITHAITPKTTDARISGKNSPQFAFVSTNGPWRNELVVVLPGTGGVPSTFTYFSENAANLGFHVVALTYENDTALANYCGNEADTSCYEEVRYEFLTGSDTTPRANVSRPNSIEFRLAAFLQWLNTTAPDEGWGQFLTRTNILWTNALAWDRFRLAGHSQGSGYAGFIGKLHEVKRVLQFAGGDFSPAVHQPAAWNFHPSATPLERFFGFTHYLDPDEFIDGEQIPNWEATGTMRFGPVINIATNVPPYSFSHAFTTTLEPLPNVNGEIGYHGATINDIPQVRDANGLPVYLPVWTQMLAGEELPPALPGEIADSVGDFTLLPGSSAWSYGYWNKSADADGKYAATEFQPLPVAGAATYGIPAYLISQAGEPSIWATGMRPLGVLSPELATNNPAGLEKWPVRRWRSTVTGTVQIAGRFAKWDSIPVAPITGTIAADGVPIWSATIAPDDLTGVTFSISARTAVGTAVDFLVAPGVLADQSGAYFTAKIAINATPTAPRFVESPQIVDGHILLSISNRAGIPLVLEGSPNLADWFPLASWSAPTNPAVYADPLRANRSMRFFRARQ